MRKILPFLFVFFTFQIGFSQSKLTKTQKLNSLCKIWGFLKYYHPEVAKGSLNWDDELIEKIKEVEKVKTKKELSNLYIKWINKLGEVKKCDSCGSKKEVYYFDKNFNLNWISDKIFYSNLLIEKLKYIEKNRNQEENQYITTVRKAGNIVVRNEREYAQEKYLEKEYRILELFRYWNLVEYFFPYKYQMDQDWNSVLNLMIPKFTHSKDLTEFQLSVLELVTKIDDSHASFNTRNLESYFGTRILPVNYAYAEGNLVITQYLNKELALKEDVWVGDIITKINGKRIKEFLLEIDKYIPASNFSVKIRKAIRNRYFSRSNKDTIILTIKRGEEILEKVCKLYTREEINIKSKGNNNFAEKWKIIEGNLGFVDMGLLEKEEVEQMYIDLKHTQAIIFDLRKYPKLTGPNLYRYFISNTQPFYNVIYPDLNYPGYFIWRNGSSYGSMENKDSYLGEIVVLIDENTQSQGEFVTMILQAHNKTTVIGSQTSGADGNVSKFKIGGFMTMFSGIGIFYPDGRETQRIGIVPDIEVLPTIKGKIEGRDEILERALRYITTRY